ncbi:MAG: hypothetical protein SWO11_07380 [Thermodesulfobacteriota bacterium]|nr:hypothetical protein [Thermodesulfobacteriota bacterium]
MEWDMGLFSWLFGSKNKKNEKPINLNGPGTFSIEIVGESHYQENLKKIAGDYSEDGVEKDVLAKVIHENDNPYDNKAISIEISGYKVGHLNKSEARYYRRKFIEYGQEGRPGICNARIRGGWKRGKNDLGYYGVVLDFPHEFIEDCEDERVEVLETDSDSPNIIIFQVDKKNIDELKECKAGDYVNLWAPASEPKKIHIFRRGTVGGSGRIGYVPATYSLIISNHLRDGLEYETELLDLNTGKIKCRLISKEETDANRSIEIKKAGERIAAELRKKYRKAPKDNFEIKIRLPKNHNQKKGNILFLEQRPIEFYIQNPTPLCISLVNSQGNTIVQKSSEPSLILRILRAYFNNYGVTIKIMSIQKPDKYTLPYIDDIEGIAIVNFEPVK